MPFNSFGSTVTLPQIAAERPRDVTTIAQLEQGKLPGRFRNTGATTRAIPSSPTDIIAGDAEGDKVNDGTNEYTLKNISGVGLRWVETALNYSW